MGPPAAYGLRSAPSLECRRGLAFGAQKARARRFAASYLKTTIQRLPSRIARFGKKQSKPSAVKRSGHPAMKKGAHPFGRAPGTPNKVSRAFKDALIWAAENSKDSKDGTLESYLLDLADNHKGLFVPMLGRLLPLQINARTQQTNKIVYSTVEEVRSALIARGLSPERADLLLLGKVPQPVEVLGDVE